MQRQVFAKCPETGVYRHQYIEQGAVKVDRLRGTSITPRGAKNGSSDYGRKVIRGGAA